MGPSSSDVRECEEFGPASAVLDYRVPCRKVISQAARKVDESAVFSICAIASSYSTKL
jgi:hypothetical protein